MNHKRISALVIVFFILFSSVASASMLGSETIKHARLDIGKGTVLETNVFWGDQSGVGYQSEYFVEYSPNSSVIPTVISGDIYGKMTTSNMASALLNGGTHPTMLINSDFFALNTGVPLSHQVSGGEVVVMDADDMTAIGFNKDSTAFVSWLSMSAELERGDDKFEIGVINKVRQPYAVYLYTDRFSDTTRAEGKGINVVVDTEGKRLETGKTIEGVVESITEDDGAVKIPDGKIVLSVDLNTAEEIVNNIKLLEEGDEISLSVSCEGDARWEDAEYILGVWGGVLIKDSQIQDIDEAAAPRTAFGIKADGTLIFYALDGRQTGHSYGARLKTLAKRLLELGCVDAVNLDGGGSTTLGTIYPGQSSMTIVNKPSDGAQRQISTFLGLINTKKPSAEASKLFVYPYTENYLSGASETFYAYATDKNYYKTDLPDDVVFIAPNGKKSYDGKMKITGDGKVSVGALSGELETEITLNCYETPTHISVKNAADSKEVTSLVLTPGESIDLNAFAYVGNKSLIGDDTCFEWSCSKSIGKISTKGIFSATDEEATGTITISAGDYSKEIETKVRMKKPYIAITFEESDDGKVRIYYNTDENIEITDANISIKVDGSEIEVPVNSGMSEIVFDDTDIHKINVTAVNEGGYKTVAGYTTQGDEYKNIFADVHDEYWAKDSITYLNHFGVINGTKEGSKTYFKPANNITRAEFAVMIANMLGIDTEDFEDIDLPMKDADKIAPWCINHIKALYELGIMSGKGSGNDVVFDATATLTRAEAATVISRLLPDMIEIKEKTFVDQKDIPQWASDAFEKLISLNMLGGYTDGTLKPNNNITRAETTRLIYKAY